MTIKSFFSLFLPIVLPCLVSCRGGNALVSAAEGGDTLHMDYAVNLSLVRYPGYVKATVRNPWDTSAVLHTYLLVPDSADLPALLPEGTVVRTPLRRALIYSSVHTGLVAELDAADAIAGVCDPRYIRQPEIAGMIADGRVADCGAAASPDIERIISLSPDGIMLSPYEDSGSHGKLGQLGIPVIECADYMEVSPLARAEWMRFYGMLFGREDEAARMFARTVCGYDSLRRLAADAAGRPRVLMDGLYGQVWYVPAANSTMGCFIRDAGGENPFDTYERGGSVGLSGEQVLLAAGDADIWLVRYAQDSAKTMAELAADNALYPQFKAFREGRVYGCNTSRVPYFEDMAFHPHMILGDLITLFHPELRREGKGKGYFTLLER